MHDDLEIHFGHTLQNGCPRSRSLPMANSDAASTVVGVLFGLLCLGVVSGELDLTSALIADHLVEA